MTDIRIFMNFIVFNKPDNIQWLIVIVAVLHSSPVNLLNGICSIRFLLEIIFINNSWCSNYVYSWYFPTILSGDYRGTAGTQNIAGMFMVFRSILLQHIPRYWVISHCHFSNQQYKGHVILHINTSVLSWHQSEPNTYQMKTTSLQVYYL